MPDEPYWECLLCGYQWEGNPNRCRQCGASKEDILPYEIAEENRRINAQEREQ